MSTDAIIQARISADDKEKAAAALKAMGLSMSEVIRVLMRRIAVEQRLPFEVRVPNAETIAAMEEARKTGGIQADSIEEIMSFAND